MNATVRRLFWGWDAPVVDKAVAFLAEGWDRASALDLSDTLVVVPNGEAGRRLREALAQETHKADTAAVIPHLWLPEQALLPPARRANAATPLQCQMAWQQALEKAELGSMTALFPKLSEERGWNWNAETARMLADLKLLLGTGGLTFAEAQAHPALQRDEGRWKDLAELERDYFTELTAVGLIDPQQLKCRNASTPWVPDGVRRLVVLASPDLPPLLDRWLHALVATGTEVTVAIHAPEDCKAAFDSYGRPLPSQWGEDAPVLLPVANAQIHVSRDSAAQAAQALDLMRALVPQASTALGVCDAEVGSLLLEKLTLEEARSFEPGGLPVQQEGMWHVLDGLRKLLSTGSWQTFTALLRVKEFRKAVAPPNSKTDLLLRQADEFSQEHLPVTLGHALELPLDHRDVLAQAIRQTAALLDKTRRLPPAQAARMLVLRLLGETEFRPEAPGQRERTELVAEWLRITEELEREASRFALKPSTEEAFSLSLEMLGRSRLAEPRGQIDLVLQGWLELLWEPSPNLVITGLNEEHVPGIFISHPFLPDGAREALELPSQQTRFARDAYLLAAMANQRADKGRLELLCGQWSEDGDALRPSRLLFLCADADLPSRVAHLFPKDEGQAAAEPARTLAWRLQPDWQPASLKVLSPSRLRDYLACPFRFYLTHTRRMSPVDAQARELDAAEFGRIIHQAFQALFKDADMKQSTHPGQIADFLEAAAREDVHARFGQHPAPLVTLQLESLVQRLRQAGEVEAKNRQTGWELVNAELQVGQDDDPAPLFLDEMRLSGRIDRVEKHADGTYRIVDFKTSDRAEPPARRHYKVLTARSRVATTDEWRCFDLPGGGQAMWLDLQLPLYVAALRQRGVPATRVAYFILPKSIQSTGVLEWEHFDDTLVEAALTCAGEAARRIREGIFWPPAARSPDNTFDEMLLLDPLHSVQPPLA